MTEALGVTRGERTLGGSATAALAIAAPCSPGSASSGCGCPQDYDGQVQLLKAPAVALTRA